MSLGLGLFFKIPAEMK